MSLAYISLESHQVSFNTYCSLAFLLIFNMLLLLLSKGTTRVQRLMFRILSC
ncbi:hypothetical protein GIB67_019691, partial [Kingdonia uniflora]